MSTLAAFISIGLACLVLAFGLELGFTLYGDGLFHIHHMMGMACLLYVFFLAAMIVASIWKAVTK